MKHTVTLYDQVVAVTNNFLGPAAERFIARQITSHLHKQPEELMEGDLEKLVEWIKVAIALLTEDNEIVEDFSRSILDLADQSAKR